MSDLITSALSFWCGLSLDQRISIVGRTIPALATILAALISAYVIIRQIGKQARNAIKQSRDNEALKLKLEIYKDIIGISRETSRAISDLKSFVWQFQLALTLSRQMQAEMGGHVIPSARPSIFTEKKSQVSASCIRVIAITETWQIIDKRISIFRTAVNTALYDVDDAYAAYFNAALRAMPVGIPDHPVDGQTFPWVPPSQEVLEQIQALGNRLDDALMTLQSYIFDFQAEMQNLLLADMFKPTIPPRAPLDAKSVVVQLDRHEELMAHFTQETNWGRNQAQIENAVRASQSPSPSGTS